MNDLEAIISLLNASERSAFLVHLKKRNKRNDTKNIQLFTAITAGQEGAIKSKMTTNAYNVLKKRLADRVIDYTATCIIETEQTVGVEIMKRLILSQKLLKLKHYKTGFKQLQKAKLKASEVSDYHLLNEIYQIYIQHSYHALSPAQDELFEAYDKNLLAYTSYANLNKVYALVRKVFESLDQGNESTNLNDLITDSFQQFGISDSDGYTFQSLSQIAEIADISGSHQRNYFEIDLFFEKQIKKLQGSAIDTEKQLPDHLKLLYIVAHIYFRKKDFKKSSIYLEMMSKQMVRYNGLYSQLYDLRHSTLLALNLNFSGQHKKASDLLDTKYFNQNINFKEPGILQAILTRIVIHFQQEELDKAKEKLAMLWHQDSWYINEVGKEWLLNKKFIEILLEIELGNSDYVDSLINSLLRKRTLYFQHENAAVLPFLKLVEAFHKNPQQIKSDAFAAKVELTFNWKPTEEEDLFLMSYYAWLKSKMTDKPVYEITLGFLNS